MFEIKYKLWLEREGRVFGQGALYLLKGVEETGSLSKAAKNLQMSYNKAHNLIKNTEQRLGFKLIISKSGGTKGGSSIITEEGKAFMENFEAFYLECDRAINDVFQKYFNK